VVVLLGAHITFCLSAFRLSSEKLGRMSQDWSFEEVYQIIHLLWQAQKAGKSLSYTDMKRQGLTTPQHQINEIMGHLNAANWVHATGSGCWLLSRDMDETTLLDLHRIIPKPLTEDRLVVDPSVQLIGLDNILSLYQRSQEENLTVPVSTLLKQKQEEATRQQESGSV
jgi:DNA-binding IscR family transcriptional regulator